MLQRRQRNADSKRQVDVGSRHTTNILESLVRYERKRAGPLRFLLGRRWRPSTRWFIFGGCICLAVCCTIIRGSRPFNDVNAGHRELANVEQTRNSDKTTNNRSIFHHSWLDRQRENTSSRNLGSVVVTAYLESPDSLDKRANPLPQRQTNAQQLKRIQFPADVSPYEYCLHPYEHFPVDKFPDDPFLPW